MENRHTWALAIHGGAGTISSSLLSSEKENEFRKGLTFALEAASEILAKGGSAIDAVTLAATFLENNPLFNAGKGSVFTNEGIVEMDASLMNGENLSAGAVAGLHNIKNPILLARKVMDNSSHVFLIGKGAESFAKEQGIEFAPDEYFFTEHRWNQLEEARKEGVVVLDHSKEKRMGTIGAVALDMKGNLAAATSTGGMTNKRFGRVGDSPMIGAGTYANNKTCSVSCTGTGEFFIRGVVAYDISCLMEYGGMSLTDACKKVIQEKQVQLGGDGGLIALDALGNISMEFNTEGMYRGWAKPGTMKTAIFGIETEM